LVDRLQRPFRELTVILPMAADGVREIVGGLSDDIEVIAGHGQGGPGHDEKEKHKNDDHVVPFHGCLRDPCGSEGVVSNGTIRLQKAARANKLCGGPAPRLAFLLRPHDNPL